ncbi:hypothetical protein CFOL_v3_00643, partial [Cephalotus follicularis]
EEEDNAEVSYDELIVIVEKYSSIISSLKKKVKSLTIENNQLLKTATLINEDKSKEEKIDILEKENECLKIEVDALKKIFFNFSNSSEKLEKLLGMQRKKKIEKDNIKNEVINKKNTNVYCNYCERNGHISASCFYKKNILSSSKIVRFRRFWVPKGTIVTNPKGPITC